MTQELKKDRPKPTAKQIQAIKDLGKYLQDNPIKGMEIKKGNR